MGTEFRNLSTEDIPPAGMTDAEATAIEELRALVLQKLGVAEARAEWAPMFRRTILLRFVRARRTTKKPIEDAATMFVAMIKWYYEEYKLEVGWETKEVEEPNT